VEFLILYVIPYTLAYLVIGVIAAVPYLFSEDPKDHDVGAVAIILWPALVVIHVGWFLLIWWLKRKFDEESP